MRIWLQVSIVVATTLSTRPSVYVHLNYVPRYRLSKGRKDTRVLLRTDGRMYSSMYGVWQTWAVEMENYLPYLLRIFPRFNKTLTLSFQPAVKRLITGMAGRRT